MLSQDHDFDFVSILVAEDYSHQCLYKTFQNANSKFHPSSVDCNTTIYFHTITEIVPEMMNALYHNSTIPDSQHIRIRMLLPYRPPH